MESVFKSIDLISEDGNFRFRLKVTDRLIAIRLQRDEKGEWREPPNGGGIVGLANPLG